MTTTRIFGTKTEYSTGEIAKLCHVAPATVVKWCTKGLLKHYRIGTGQYKYRRVTAIALREFLLASNIIDDELSAWLAANQPAPKPLYPAKEEDND